MGQTWHKQRQSFFEYFEPNGTPDSLYQTIIGSYWLLLNIFAYLVRTTQSGWWSVKDLTGITNVINPHHGRQPSSNGGMVV